MFCFAVSGLKTGRYGKIRTKLLGEVGRCGKAGEQFLNLAPPRLIVLHIRQTDETVLNTLAGFASWAECGSGLRRYPLPAALPVTCVVTLGMYVLIVQARTRGS